MDQVLRQVTGVIDSALATDDSSVVWGALHILTLLKERPKDLTEMAYRWCVMVWKKRDDQEALITYGWGWRTNIRLCLEFGFRHIRFLWPPPLTDAEHHRGLFEMDFGPDDSEAVTDLAWASLMIDPFGEVGFSVCANFILKLHGRAIPPNLRKMFIFFVESTECRTLEHVGKRRCVELLNPLQIGIQDRGGLCSDKSWAVVLLGIVQSTEAQNLAIQSWEFLVELAIKGGLKNCRYNPDVVTSLVDRKEWDKLECWMGIVWGRWPPEPGNAAKELEDVMEVLEKERPGAVQKLMQWMERWREEYRWTSTVPGTFQQTYDKLAL